MPERVIAEVPELKQRVSEAKRLDKEGYERAFKANRAYNVLEAKTNELREEWLGLCEVLKERKPKAHLTGLRLLAQRVRTEYFNIRLARRRLKARKHELLIEADRLHEEYVRLKRCLIEQRRITHE